MLGFLAFWPYLNLAYYEYFYEGVWRGFPGTPIFFGCFSGIPFGIAGVVLGVIYLKKAPRNKVNNALSIIGILLGVGGIIGHIWYIFTCKFCN